MRLAEANEREARIERHDLDGGDGWGRGGRGGRHSRRCRGRYGGITVTARCVTVPRIGTQRTEVGAAVSSCICLSTRVSNGSIYCHITIRACRGWGGCGDLKKRQKADRNRRKDNVRKDGKSVMVRDMTYLCWHWHCRSFRGRYGGITVTARCVTVPRIGTRRTEVGAAVSSCICLSTRVSNGSIYGHITIRTCRGWGGCGSLK